MSDQPTPDPPQPRESIMWTRPRLLALVAKYNANRNAELFTINIDGHDYHFIPPFAAYTIEYLADRFELTFTIDKPTK